MKESRVVEVVDIVNDKVADHHYKESEDLSQFTSRVYNDTPENDPIILIKQIINNSRRQILI